MMRVLRVLPCVWADMALSGSGRHFHYTARRRWEGRASSDLVVEVGAPHRRPAHPLDDFLANRWCLHANGPLGLVRADFDHGPSPLHDAAVVTMHDEFAAATGHRTTGPPAHVRDALRQSVRRLWR